MNMRDHERILRSVLNRIKPRDSEYNYLRTLSHYVVTAVDQCLETLGHSDYEVSVQGSYAKDTFVSGDVDLDVFMLFKPGSVRIEDFELRLIKELKCCLESRGLKVILEYATHPYLTLFIGGVEVNVVPAFKVPNPSNIISAVDRTPFHTMYVKSKLDERARDEVRLLKAFMKGIGVYGAEVKVQGFSGYLAELLVIKYGSFIDVLKGSLEWKPFKTCIDIEGYYASTRECLKRFPRAPLIVVDPVDPRRNAAAAVSLRSLSKFRICASLFLECPSEKFFVSYAPRASIEELKKSLDRACKDQARKLLLVISRVLYAPEDVVWGQLRRLERSLANQLRSKKIELLYIDSYLDLGKNLAYTLIDVYGGSIPWELHEGPPSHVLIDAIKFIKRNLRSDVGPWIDIDNRLMCLRPRDVVEVTRLAIRSLELTYVKPIEVVDLCKDQGIASKISGMLASWLYEAVNRKYFSYLLEGCID